MRPLEAAQDILAHGPPMIEDAWCGICQHVIQPLPGIDAGPHADFCPWLQMPQIVAALEAAEAVIDSGTEEDYLVTVDDEPWGRLALALHPGKP